MLFFKKVSFLFAAMIAALSLSAQINLAVDVPGVVETGETFRLVFSVNGQPSSFNPPQIVDFSVLAGPSSSTMSSTQIVNGQRSESFQVSYTYVLQANKEGRFTIPSASVLVDGKTISSQPVTIEVVKSDGATTGERGTRSTATVSNEDIFLRITLSKSRVVKGEALTATIKLYTRVPVSGFEEVRFPSFNGFWSQEIETPQNIEFVRENVDGRIYDAALLRRYMLYPQQTGDITIDAAEMVCQIRLRQTSSAQRSIFDDFFDSYQTVRKRVTSPSIRINVAPLPGGAPASFSGGVGEFSMSASLTRDSVNANEALSLIVTISGSGNLNLIEAPSAEFPAGFEVYDTRTTDNTNRGARGATGSKQFEYPFIPRGPGDYSIPSIEFSYYDISSRGYKTLISGDLTLKVGRGEASGSQGVVTSSGVNRQSVRNISDDIRFISTGPPRLKSKNLFFVGSVSFYLIVAFIILAFFIIERLLSRTIKRNRDVAGVRNRRANKVARNRLKKAGALLKEGLYTSFYEELYRALLGYVSDKLNLSLADMSRDKINELLTAKSVNSAYVGELLYLLEQCEYARYAPDPGGGEMDLNYTRAMKLISQMEL